MKPAGSDALKVGLISQEFPPHTNWGGIAVYMGMLAQSLAARGHQVRVVSRRTCGAPEFEALGPNLAVYRIGAPLGRKRFVGRTVDRLLRARTVARLVRRLDLAQPFDVLETTEANFEADVLLRDPAFARRLVIQCNGSNAMGQAVDGPLAALHRLDWAWSLRHELQGLARVSRVVVTSEATRGVLLSQGISADKLRLIGQGIDTARFHPAPRRPSGPIQVGFVGRLERRKGVDFIWRVAEVLQGDERFILRLKGAIHPSTRAETLAKLQRFKGIVQHEEPGPPDEMPAFYQGLDALVLPSRFENFGLAYAEAMAVGLVVFGGAGGSGREVIRDGDTGFLVDPDGPVDRVVGELRRLADDRGAFDGLRARARAEVEQRFSLAACIDRKVALYRELA